MGAHGSAALWHLSRTGKKVAGMDRFYPPHRHGSSHGQSRIIRQAYHENPLYVPLVKAAYPLWKELSELTGRPLFKRTGGLLLGSEDSVVIKGSRLSATTHNIPFEYLDASAIYRRFPAFRPGPDTVAVLEHDAGILFPEDAISTSLELAAANGATLLTGTEVTKITPLSNVIEITTNHGKYTTGKLIVTAGAWLNTLLPELKLPLTINRQPVFWFAGKVSARDPRVTAQGPPQPQIDAAHMPIFIWELSNGKMFYGFPDIGHGLKIAWHHGGRKIDPDQLTQKVEPEEITEMQNLIKQYLNIDPKLKETSVCMYTNTPDEDFIIDFHPQHPRIIIASPCSGHGFKFSPVIGRILTDLAIKAQTDFDLTPFSINRKSFLLEP